MSGNAIPPELEFADDSDDPRDGGAGQRRIRVVAWIVIGALLLTGGGATILTLFFS